MTRTSTRPAALAAVLGTLLLSSQLWAPAARPGLPHPPQLELRDGLHRPFATAVGLTPLASDPDPDVPVAPAGIPRVEPSVAVDPRDARRVAVAAVDYGLVPAPQAEVLLSTDGGRSFRPPKTFPLSKGATFSGDPSLAYDRQGRLFFSYAEYAPAGTRGAGGVVVVRSDDGGLTWEPRPTRLAVDTLEASGGRCHFHDKDEVTTDPRSGEVLVAWSDENYDGSRFCGRDVAGPVLLARSTDHGRHFAVAVAVPEDVETVGALPRVGPDGTVYVAYTRYEPTSGCNDSVSFGVTEEVARSHDGGRTFDAVDALSSRCKPYGPSTTGGTYRTSTFPALEVLRDRSVVLVTAVQGAAGTTGELHSELVAVRSRDGGRTWRPAAVPAMSPAAQYQFPRLAPGPDGRLVLTYLEQQPGGLFSTLLSTSRDAGLTWSTPVTVSTSRSFGTNPQFDGGFDGDYIGLAVGPDGVAHPAWTDVRNPVPEVAGENVWTRRVHL